MVEMSRDKNLLYTKNNTKIIIYWKLKTSKHLYIKRHLLFFVISNWKNNCIITNVGVK